MFKSNQTHNFSGDEITQRSATFFNEDKLASKSGAVVLFNTGKQDYKAQRFIAASMLAVSLGLISLQANWVYNASAEGSPVTSPVTSEESPSPSSEPVTSPEVSPSPSSNPSNNGGSNGGNGGNSGGGSSNSGGSVGAPGCSNEAPKSAPKIISAVTSGKNQITLTWEKAEGPLTHYVLAYGLEKGKPLYGNPNIGNVTSFTVNQLSSGFTYYFKVRAGNDCQTGVYSNEIAVKVGGSFINSPAQGFKPGVLGKSKSSNTVFSAPSASPKVVTINYQTQNTIPDAGLIGKIFNFFAGFFN